MARKGATAFSSRKVAQCRERAGERGRSSSLRRTTCPPADAQSGFVVAIVAVDAAPISLPHPRRSPVLALFQFCSGRASLRRVRRAEHPTPPLSQSAHILHILYLWDAAIRVSVKLACPPVYAYHSRFPSAQRSSMAFFSFCSTMLVYYKVWVVVVIFGRRRKDGEVDGILFSCARPSTALETSERWWGVRDGLCSWAVISF